MQNKKIFIWIKSGKMQQKNFWKIYLNLCFGTKRKLFGKYFNWIGIFNENWEKLFGIWQSRGVKEKLILKSVNAI